MGQPLARNAVGLRRRRHPRQDPAPVPLRRAPPEFYQRFWSAIRGGVTWRGEVVNRRRDGRLYTASQTVTPLINNSGQVSHFVAILEDISERKATEERMHHTANYDALTDLPNRACFWIG